MGKPQFSVGIEEEYTLVNVENYALINEIHKDFWPMLKSKIGDRASPEFLQCQVEIGTGVCHTMQQASAELRELRCAVSQVAGHFDLAMVAASTHPFSRSGEQTLTDNERYHVLAKDMQQVVRRLLISGMHVHVGIDDDDLRIDLMNQANYILPHLLALSTSSPFWNAKDSGLKSYRIAVWNEMPRTGLPAHFESYGEYKRHVDILTKVGVIEDATKIWWDLRPSDRFPTLEMRISDVCTDYNDAICIASLYRCWMHMLYRLRVNNQRWRQYATFMIDENRWRAHRYGIDEGLIDFGSGSIKPYAELLREMYHIIEEDAQALDCEKEVQHAFKILERKTSAHWQVQHYEQALAQGKSKQESLQAVVKMLAERSIQGCE